MAACCTAVVLWVVLVQVLAVASSVSLTISNKVGKGRRFVALGNWWMTYTIGEIGGGT